MNEPAIWLYVGFLLIYRISENVIVLRSGSWKRRPTGDVTLWLLIVTYLATVIGPIVEFYSYQRDPGVISWTIGGLLFLATAVLRGWGQVDLKKAFSPVVEVREGQSLVDTGIYRHIRHPLYLGVLCLFMACPIFLASVYSWLFSVAGIGATFLRLRVEERFLRENLEGYREYMQRTAALLPGIY